MRPMAPAMPPALLSRGTSAPRARAWGPFGKLALWAQGKDGRRPCFSVSSTATLTPRPLSSSGALLHSHRYTLTHSHHSRAAGPISAQVQLSKGCLTPQHRDFPSAPSEHLNVSPALPSRPPVGLLVSLGPRLRRKGSEKLERLGRKGRGRAEAEARGSRGSLAEATDLFQVNSAPMPCPQQVPVLGLAGRWQPGGDGGGSMEEAVPNPTCLLS